MCDFAVLTEACTSSLRKSPTGSLPVTGLSSVADVSPAGGKVDNAFARAVHLIKSKKVSHCLPALSVHTPTHRSSEQSPVR